MNFDQLIMLYESVRVLDSSNKDDLNIPFHMYFTFDKRSNITLSKYLELLKSVTQKNSHVIVYINDDGAVHNDNGPAMIITYEDGVVSREWYKNGVRHRNDGPAHITDYGPEFGNESAALYYINGAHKTKEEYDAYYGNVDDDNRDALDDMMSDLD